MKGAGELSKSNRGGKFNLTTYMHVCRKYHNETLLYNKFTFIKKKKRNWSNAHILYNNLLNLDLTFKCKGKTIS
jgi:hypothetical protein